MALPTGLPESQQYAPYSGYRDAVSSNTSKLHANLEYMANILTWMGWSFNAICAALGCWRVECYVCPNFPQYTAFPGYRTATSSSGNTYKNWGGFGMPHWTQWYPKFGVWAQEQYGLTATANDSNPLRNFYLQMLYHEYECTNGIYKDYNYGISAARWYRAGTKTWYSNHGYSYSWGSWKTSNDSIDALTKAYFWEYERSAGGETSANNRAGYAANYATYLRNNWTYTDPSSGDQPTPDPDPDPGPDPDPEPDPEPDPKNRFKRNFIIVAKSAGLF